MYSAKDQLVKALALYFDAPKGNKASAAWATKYMEQEMRYLGFDSKQMAKLMMPQYWEHQVDQQIDAVFVDDSVDVQTLEKSCPRVDGLWIEVLRMTVSTSSVRYVTEDVTIGGKRHTNGNVVINPRRQLHFDESVFGKSPLVFDPARFLTKNNLEQSRSWKPFGRGIYMYPGRFIAKRTTCMFIALVLRRLDIKLAYPQRFPKGHDKTLDLGVFAPDQDLILCLTRMSTN
ncbi:MAG: hypothetical protein Q9208_007621 [Pyrenodesmia sp. 3 TL-2023]